MATFLGVVLGVLFAPIFFMCAAVALHSTFVRGDVDGTVLFCWVVTIFPFIGLAFSCWPRRWRQPRRSGRYQL